MRSLHSIMVQGSPQGLEPWLGEVFCLPTLSFLLGQGAGSEKAQGWCYRPGLFINSFLYRFSSFSNNQSRLFCKGRYMSCVLIYYFVEQIFAENIPCLGPWCRGAGKKAVRADETSLWLTQCLGVNEPRGMALNGIR